MKTISYGGGVQSTAMIVLAVQGEIPDVEAALFANVGDDSEHPATLEYVRTISKPWADARGLPVHELHRVMRDGTTRTLVQDLTRDSRTINIPVRMGNGAPGNRNCTSTYKIAVVGKWLKAHGASPQTPAEVCIGISTDEYLRAGNKKAAPYERPVYPLLDLGYSRQDCMNIIRGAGLPVPPKSACWFCPFHRPQTWREMRRDEPDLFEASAALEDLLNERRDQLGKDHVYLTRFGKPLRDAIGVAQDMLPIFGAGDLDNGGQCDDGYCWT